MTTAIVFSRNSTPGPDSNELSGAVITLKKLDSASLHGPVVGTVLSQLRQLELSTLSGFELNSAMVEGVTGYWLCKGPGEAPSLGELRLITEKIKGALLAGDREWSSTLSFEAASVGRFLGSIERSLGRETLLSAPDSLGQAWNELGVTGDDAGVDTLLHHLHLSLGRLPTESEIEATAALIDTLSSGSYGEEFVKRIDTIIEAAKSLKASRTEGCPLLSIAKCLEDLPSRSLVQSTETGDPFIRYLGVVASETGRLPTRDDLVRLQKIAERIHGKPEIDSRILEQACMVVRAAGRQVQVSEMVSLWNTLAGVSDWNKTHYDTKAKWHETPSSRDDVKAIFEHGHLEPQSAEFKELLKVLKSPFGAEIVHAIAMQGATKSRSEVRLAIHNSLEIGLQLVQFDPAPVKPAIREPATSYFDDDHDEGGQACPSPLSVFLRRAAADSRLGDESGKGDVGLAIATFARSLQSASPNPLDIQKLWEELTPEERAKTAAKAADAAVEYKLPPCDWGTLLMCTVEKSVSLKKAGTPLYDISIVVCS